MNRMKQFVVTLSLVISGCATPATEIEIVSFPFGQISEDGELDWKVGHEAEVPGQFSITEFIRQEEEIENWTELVTIQSFLPPWGGPSPEDSLNELKAIRERTCPNVTIWNVIAEDETSILYEWQAMPCLSFSEQHEIAKILYGTSQKFLIRYTVKDYQMQPEQRAEWIDNFSKAETNIVLTEEDGSALTRTFNLLDVLVD